MKEKVTVQKATLNKAIEAMFDLNVARSEYAGTKETRAKKKAYDDLFKTTCSYCEQLEEETGREVDFYFFYEVINTVIKRGGSNEVIFEILTLLNIEVAE